MKTSLIGPPGVVLCIIALLSGCVGEQTAKTSHFEHDHEIAAHWPANLADAAAKIRSRLDSARVDDAKSNPHVKEIEEIVSWVPEIAADTDLAEQDWIPIDNAAEQLSSRLRASGYQMTPSNRGLIIALCEQIEGALVKIPDPTSPMKVMSP
jgi:hypothetical protein